jgi:hypothetical protein
MISYVGSPPIIKTKVAHLSILLNNITYSTQNILFQLLPIRVAIPPIE